MLVTISYKTEEVDFNTEAVLNMLALATDGKPVSHLWITENGKRCRSLTFHLPDHKHSEQELNEFREAITEHLTLLGYNPTAVST